MGDKAIGVVGLGVMGRNLAWNIEEKGFPVAVYNRSPDPVHQFVALSQGKAVEGALKKAAEVDGRRASGKKLGRLAREIRMPVERRRQPRRS